MTLRLPLWAAALALFLHSPAGHPAETAQTIWIGFAAPLTWPAVQNARDAVQLALDEANRLNPRIAGKPAVFRLYAQDDRDDPATAAFVARAMAQAGVSAVIGHWTSEATEAAAESYHGAGLAHLSPSAAGARYTRLGYATSFRMVGHLGDAAAAICQYLSRVVGAKRVAVLDDGTRFGTELGDAFETCFRPAGDITARKRVSNNTSDFNAVVSAFRDQAPDVLFFSGRKLRSEDLVAAMRRHGLRARLFLTGSAVTSLLWQDRATLKEGVVTLSAGILDMEAPAYRYFAKAFGQGFGSDLAPYTLTAYDAAKAILAAIRRADSAAPADVVAALHALDQPGLAGRVRFDARGDLVQAGYTFYEMRAQRWEAFRRVLVDDAGKVLELPAGRRAK